MKFNNFAVIGNPPYQKSDKSGKHGGAGPIYQKFIESSIDYLSPEYLCFIVPSRWMLGGKGLNKFRERMMADKKIKSIHHFDGASTVFKGVEINGGVNYFLWDKSYNGKCNFINDGIERERFLNEYDIIIQDNNSIDIVNKVLATSKEQISERCLPINPFGLLTTYSLFVDNGTRCICQKREVKYIPNQNFRDRHNILNKWKVCVGAIDNIHRKGRRYSKNTPFVLEAGGVCLSNYLVVNTFSTNDEALNFVAYMKTKFFRLLLSLRVAGLQLSREKFSFVPQLDMTKIWTDEMLYERYNLSGEEIAFIEKRIRPLYTTAYVATGRDDD